jgi:hypothetical protein
MTEDQQRQPSDQSVADQGVESPTEAEARPREPEPALGDGDAPTANAPSGSVAADGLAVPEAPVDVEAAKPSAVADAATPEPAQADVGPDPLWGAASAFLGFFVMAFGGATDRHYVFNAGSALMLLGAFAFMLQLGVTSYRQRPFHPVKALRALLQRRP